MQTFPFIAGFIVGFVAFPVVAALLLLVGAWTEPVTWDDEDYRRKDGLTAEEIRRLRQQQ